MTWQKKIIVTLLFVGIELSVSSLILFGYVIPQIDNKIEQKNYDIQMTLWTLNLADFQMTASNIYRVNYLLSREIIFFTNSTHNCENGDIEKCDDVSRAWTDYKNAISAMIKENCFSSQNCTNEDIKAIDNATSDELGNMIKSFSDKATKNLLKMDDDIRNLKNIKDNALLWALSWQILGLLFIQIATFFQWWFDKRKS